MKNKRSSSLIGFTDRIQFICSFHQFFFYEVLQMWHIIFSVIFNKTTLNVDQPFPNAREPLQLQLLPEFELF